MGLALGCKSTEQSSPTRRTSSPSSSSPSSTVQPDVAAPAEGVQTIQLYRGDDESSLPVVPLDGGAALTLEFDLLRQNGRPLSIYFQHADRHWRRDLSSSQILESFQHDRLLDYRSSRGTEVPYVHYVYRFPNDEIRFRLSGNYILRVTERGRRDSVLFEQPFFVAEGAGSLQVGAEPVVVPGQPQPSRRPSARYTPPSRIRGDPFGYTVCFVRNGRLADTRCKERPLLVRQPELKFRLDRDRAYAPITAGYNLDLSVLRSTDQIARIDRTRSPVRIVLSPDYARFMGSPSSQGLKGQTVIRAALTGRVDPALSAEYVETTFAFVPAGGRPYSRPLILTGSFSGMTPNRGTTMRWNSSRGRYEGTVLLKQGTYQYFYSSSDPAFAKQMRGTRTRTTGTYTAFVYYRDARYNTDRLLRVGGFSP
ncbi:MAG: type IX secretion system plug protein domain-containing protein [Salinibacter sp.]